MFNTIEKRREYLRRWSKTPKGRAKAKRSRKRNFELNREKNLKRMKLYYNRNKELIGRYKNRPCMDCGGWYEPCQMDFDHRPNEKKLFGISIYRSLKLSSIIAELRKCDIVCANCHRLRTFNRGQHSSRKLRDFSNDSVPADSGADEARVPESL